MPSEYLFLQQLLGSVIGFGQATLMASLFLVLVFRPERIRHRGLFSLACWLFALSVLIPPVINLLLGALGGGLLANPRNLSGTGGYGLVLAVAMGCGPILFGLSLLMALLALRPGPPPGPFQPPKHPLD